MAALYSLALPPPPGFVFVNAYERRLFRGRPFALFASSLLEAEAFLSQEPSALRGVLVCLQDSPTSFVLAPSGHFHLCVATHAAAVLLDIVQPLLSIIDAQAKAVDQVRSAQYELERAVLNQQRMADEFEAVRSSLLGKLAERRAAEERLKESGRMVRALLNSSFELVGVLSPQGVLMEANRTSLEFAGIPFERVRGLPFWQTPWFEHSPELQDQVKKAIERAARGESSRFEVTHIDHAGVAHDIDFSLTPSFDEHGHVEFLVPEGWDITDRKRAEEQRELLQTQLMQTQKLESIGRLAGGVAHDFNNMLAVILGRAELALSEVGPNTALREDLEEIRKTAERSAQLTRQLLTFARRQAINPISLDLNEAVSSTLSMLRRLIGEDVKLTWLPGSTLWSVKLDPSQLDQLLANLVVNARDAIRGNGAITISTQNQSVRMRRLDSLGRTVDGDFVALSVKDSGEGMSPDVRERMFEPFFTTKKLGRGTGLGLSMVLGIVEQHEGFIEVFSEPNRGTEIIVYLPRVDEASANVVRRDRDSVLPLGQETLLLVEDERVVLELQERVLTRLGYEVISACGPLEALALMADGTKHIDLLLTDVIMPDMNGRELVEELTRTRPGLRCLFMSGYSADVFSKKGIIDAEVDFIQKPFTLLQIARKLREVLDRPSARAWAG